MSQESSVGCKMQTIIKIIGNQKIKINPGSSRKFCCSLGSDTLPTRGKTNSHLGIWIFFLEDEKNSQKKEGIDDTVTDN